MNGSEADDAVRAAWLYHLGGYTQGQIARRMGLSRVKVNRLIATAHEEHLVTISVNHKLDSCLRLEEAIVRQHEVPACIVVPRLGIPGAPDELAQLHAALGNAGARLLANHLRTEALSILGVGWGRTLASMVAQLDKISRSDLRIVSLLGSLTRYSATNPFDVVHHLTNLTSGMGFFLPVPFLADTAHDAAVLKQQKTVQDIWHLAERADLYVIGLGALEQYERFDRQGLLQSEDMTRLREAGSVGDILGSFINHEGRLVESEVNDRAMGLPLSRLQGRNVIAIAGGSEKVDIIEASLRSGVITTLITDEDTAEAIAARS